MSSLRIRALLVRLLVALALFMAPPIHVAAARASLFGGEHPSPVLTQSVGEVELKAFIRALQKAMAADNRAGVASMIRYPIVIWVRDRDVLFRTPESLVASYDLIFTVRLKKFIAEAKAETLFSNWRGVMIQDGEVWINQVSPNHLKITTINAQPIATGEESQQTAHQSIPDLKIHPKVFSMIDSWDSDTGSPVVTEINLDAVSVNGNQFDGDIKQEGAWISCANDAGGFTRYEVLERVGDRYTVQYSESGGGSLTTSAIIDFSIETRTIKKDGNIKSIRVLRVLGFTAN